MKEVNLDTILPDIVHVPNVDGTHRHDDEGFVNTIEDKFLKQVPKLEIQKKFIPYAFVPAYKQPSQLLQSFLQKKSLVRHSSSVQSRSMLNSI